MACSQFLGFGLVQLASFLDGLDHVVHLVRIDHARDGGGDGIGGEDVADRHAGHPAVFLGGRALQGSCRP